MTRFSKSLRTYHKWGLVVIPLMAVAFALLVLLAAGPPAYGQPAFLFEDDFNDGDDDGWAVVEGTWTVVDGVYVAPDPGGWNLVAKSIAGEDWWDDYTFEGRFMLQAGAHEATLLFRVQWALPGVNHGKFYQIVNGLGGLTLAEMYGVQGGANAISLETAPYSLDADMWYDFRIVLTGPSMEYYIDDDLVMSYDGLTSYSTGKIGLKTGHYGEAYFDDILVYLPAASSTPTPTATATPTSTATPTITPTPPPPVGGIPLAGDLAGLPLEAPGSSGSNAALAAGIAGAVAAGAVALGGAAWYTRRRWLT